MPGVLVITFTVPGVPVAQPRQRHRVVTAGGRTFAQNYVAKTDPVNSFKAQVRLACSQAYQGAPLTGPLMMTLVFLFPRPAYLLKPKSPPERLPYARKPDADNLAKSCADALNGLLYGDDSQIVHLQATKLYVAKDEAAKVTVQVTQA